MPSRERQPGGAASGGFAAAHLEEVESVEVWDGVVRRAVRDHFELDAFGANVYVAPRPGVELIEPHDHRSGGGGPQQELYVVLSGHAEFTIDGARVDAPAGTFVRVEAECARAATAREAGTAVLAIGAPKGAAYAPPSWPASAGMWRYRALREEGRFDAAAEFLDHLLVRYPDNADLLFERARCRARLSQPELAASDLARALDRDARLAARAADEADFASLERDAFLPPAQPDRRA